MVLELVTVPASSTLRFRVPALLSMILIIAGVMSVTTGPARAASCSAHHHDGPWARVDAPLEVDAIAADPLDPDRVLATDGTSIVRTLDGGCSWSTVWELPTVPSDEVPAAKGTSRIVALATAPEAEGTVVAAIEGNRPAQLPSTVVVSRDGGESWAPAAAAVSDRLAPGNLPLEPRAAADLMVAPADARRVYLLLGEVPLAGVVLPPVLYVSNDGGTTFDPVAELARGFEGASEWSLTVDPLEADVVYLKTESGLERSIDAGRTFERLDVDSERPRVLDLHHRPGSPARVLLFERTDTVFRSDDGGTRWQATNYPDGQRQAIAAAHGTGPDDVLLAVSRETGSGDAVGGRVFRLTPSGVWTDVSPTDRPHLADLTASRPAGGATTVWARSRTAFSDPGVHVGDLYRYRGPLDTTTDPSGTDDDARPSDGAATVYGLTSRQPAPFPPATLTVTPAQIDLRPDTDDRAIADVRVPTDPGPVDVAFLVDTTRSMEPAIAALRREAQAIIDELAGAGFDARYGVAEFQDVSMLPWGNVNTVPYRRLVDLVAPGPELASALSRLYTTEDETPQTSGLGALVRTATSDGPYGPQPGMSWRPGARRLIVAVTDAPFHREPGYPGPSAAKAYDALRAADTTVIGLSVEVEATQSTLRGRPHLSDVARATGALAANDVDCDGDGRVDLPAGQPLVCPLTGTTRDLLAVDPVTPGLGRAVAELIAALPLPATLRFEAVAGRTDWVTGVPDPIPLDRRRPSAIDRTLGLRCRAGDAGQAGTIALRATLDGRPIATTTLRVTCLGTNADIEAPAPVEPPPVAESGPVPDAGRPTAPAPPPPTASAGAGAPSPAQASAPAVSVGVVPVAAPAAAPSAPSLVAALRQQEEVALAHAGASGEDGTASTVPPPAVLLATALAAATVRRIRNQRTAGSTAPVDRPSAD